jgi:hypothetical protein
MLRQIVLFLSIVVCVPAIAQATVTITAGNWVLPPETAGQDINILLTADEDYTDGNMRVQIGAGGPPVTHVFGDTMGAITGALLAGSIWENGAGGINLGADGTTATSTGLQPIALFLTAGGGSPQQTDGIFATLTFDTTGIAPGVYVLSLTDHPNGQPTDIFNGLDPATLDPIPVGNLVLENGTLTVTPEPASMVIWLFAVAALAAIAVRGRMEKAD